MSGALSAGVRDLLDRAAQVYADRPEVVDWLGNHRDRLDGPLRVAIAGKVKAGKSTLLNALVGDRIAPTDAAECTRVVTWYREGHSPGIVLYPHAGRPVALPVDRRDGSLVIDLGGVPVADVERLEVDWPSSSLRSVALIDTPGISSLSTETAQRTLDFLDPDDDTPTEADAVIYLMRHVHAADAAFLEAFRDQGVARAASVNTLAVISRADEIGGGRVEGMYAARAVAERYRREPALRGLCQNVVAVAGLIAETGRTLRHAEFVALAALARVPRRGLDELLLTADRFVHHPLPAEAADADLPGADLSGAARSALLARFGVYGVRLATTLIRQRAAPDAATLAEELVRRSGLHELQDVVHAQFAERRDVLKSRSALHALAALVRSDPRPSAGTVTAGVERLLAGAHEFVEIRTLTAVRSRAVVLPPARAAEAEQVLGGHGASPARRLGLAPDTDPRTVRAAVLDTLVRWQDYAENPMTDRAAAEVARVAVRSCEGLLTGPAAP